MFSRELVVGKIYKVSRLRNNFRFYWLFDPVRRAESVTLQDEILIITKDQEKATITILTRFGIRYFFNLDLWDMTMKEL